MAIRPLDSGTYTGRLPGAAKKYPPKEFANVSRTIKRNDKKFYTRVTHSSVRKSGKFHYIICRIYKKISYGNLAVGE